MIPHRPLRASNVPIAPKSRFRHTLEKLASRLTAGVLAPMRAHPLDPAAQKYGVASKAQASGDAWASAFTGVVAINAQIAMLRFVRSMQAILRSRVLVRGCESLNAIVYAW